MSVLAETRASFPLDRAPGTLRRRVIGAAGASTAVIVSSWSHIRGGGSASGLIDLGPLLLGTALVGALLGHRRWSFSAMLSALVVLQPAVHLTMSLHGSAMGDPSSMMGDQASSPWTMVAMHAVGVVIIAVTLRHGARWVSTMPALLTAALGLRRPTVMWPVPHLMMLAIDDRRALRELAGCANWSRGPPR